MATVDLRPTLPPVRNQRGLHSCMALALSDIIWRDFHRRSRNHESIEPFLPSALFIYHNARRRVGHENHNIAVHPSEAMRAVREFGVCPEEVWPYRIGRHRERPPAIAYEMAQATPDIDFEGVGQDAGSLEASLDAGIPFVFCLRLFPSNCRHFEYGETAATGHIKVPRNGEPEVRNHAMLAVGYDDRAGEFLVRNSFGEAWGSDGYVRVPYDYLLHPARAYAFWRVV